MMTQLYDVDVRTINYQLKTILADSELKEDAVILNFRITAPDGKTYDTKRLTATDREVLQDAGKVTAEIARPSRERVREVAHRAGPPLFESDLDRVVAEPKRLGQSAAKGTPRKRRKP